MSFVEANGLTFHVQELGQGPPVAMIHGMFLGNLASWYFSVAPMLAGEHRVLMYDLRGHGRSERATHGYDLATLSEDLGALIDRFGQRPVDLVGHSYGGLIALRFALERPERVRRLVVVEAPLPPQQAEETRGLLDLRPDDLLGVMSPEKLKAAIRGAGYDAEELLGELLPAGMKENLLGSGRRLRSFFRSLHFLLTRTTIQDDVRVERDFSDRLDAIRSPVLCVYGRSSSCRPAGDLLAAGLPDARLRILEGGHYVTVERPLELGREIREFLHG